MIVSNCHHLLQKVDTLQPTLVTSVFRRSLDPFTIDRINNLHSEEFTHSSAFP